MVITQIHENSSQSELLKEINKDVLDKETKTSTIDLMTRLNDDEISFILAIDSLVMLEYLPVSLLSFTRQKKRLNVSKDGDGRKEILRIFEQNKDTEEKKQRNFLSRLVSGDT